MAKSRYVIGIDTGSSKVCAAAARVTDSGVPEILAVTSSPSRGLKNGLVVDLAQATESVQSAVEMIEDRLSIRVRSALVGFGGDHVQGQNSTGVVTITEPGGEIRPRDVHHALDIAQTVPLPLERHVLHVISQGFVIDGIEGVADPRQMHGTRLEARLHMITVLMSRARNISRCVQGAGLSVEDMVLSSFASSYSVLTPEEKRLGVTLIDMGGGTTTVLAFGDGKLRYTEVVAWGGDNLTDLIARHFKVDGETAEMLKVRYGTLQLEERYQKEKIRVAGDETEYTVISRAELTEVIRAEVDDVLGRMGDTLTASGCLRGSTYGLVLTGGTSSLDGILEFTEGKLGVPVKLGLPRGFETKSEQVYNPGYAGSLGLLRYGVQNRKSRKINLVSWLVNVFGNYF